MNDGHHGFHERVINPPTTKVKLMSEVKDGGNFYFYIFFILFSSSTSIFGYAVRDDVESRS